jgi:predicted RNA-binding Zn ribbon-like protein
MWSVTGAAVGREWKLVGGSLPLDFVNTVSWRRTAPTGIRAGEPDRPRDVDTLVGFEDLLSWSAIAGAVAKGDDARLRREAGREPGQAARVLARAIVLREALYRIFTADNSRRGPDSNDLAILNRELSVARAQEHLVATPGAFAWSWSAAPVALDRPLWPIARAAGELLTSAARRRVRQCAGDACGWLFLDTTRNHSRQWCDMRDCGNLAKVRRFRQRARRVAKGGRPGRAGHRASPARKRA